VIQGALNIKAEVKAEAAMVPERRNPIYAPPRAIKTPNGIQPRPPLPLISAPRLSLPHEPHRDAGEPERDVIRVMEPDDGSQISLLG
jgi:hypothetical protein